MAIGTPVLVADSAGNSSETTNSTTCTTQNSGSAVAAGDLLVLLATARVTATLTISSVTATAGSLTYTTEIDVGPSSANNGGCAVIYALNPSGIASGTSWTATWSAAATRKALSVYSVSGLATSSVADSPIHNNVGNPTGGTGNDTCTNDAASAQADEIMFHCVKQSNSVAGVTATSSSGWNEIQDRIVGASTFMHHYAAYRIISAIETSSITVTFTTTGTNFLACTAGFKMAAAAAAAQVPRRPIQRGSAQALLRR